MRIFLQLGWYFRQEWRRYSVAFLMLGVIAALTMVPAWQVGKVVDRIVAGDLTADFLGLAVGTMLSAALVIYVLRFCWRALLYGASYRLAALLRQRLYAKFMAMDPWFFQRYGTGDLMARATNDVTAVEMTAGEGILTLVDGLLTGLIVLGVLLWLNWQLALLGLLPWPVMSYFMWKFGEELHESFGRAQAFFSRLNDQVHYGLTGLRVIRALGLERWESERFNAIASDTNLANAAVARVDAKYDPVIYLTIGFSFLFSIGGGAWFVREQQMTLGELTTFTMYMGHMIWPMFAYGWMLNIVERGSAANARLQVLFAEQTLQPRGTQQALDVSAPLRVDIEAFRFPGETTSPVLHDVRFTLACGNTLGLVGPTGAGKSTLVYLLAGVHVPGGEGAAGSLHWGDADLAQLDPAVLRRHLAVVPQEPFLFSATIAENIALGAPDATPSMIEQAARVACVHDDILGLEQGYDTLVGERGVTLSGGQKQRISIARALLLEPDFLILDDALSAVDAETERRILAAFRALRAGRTTLIVTHRMSAVEHADEILVLDEGSVVARGTHAGLLAEEGWYARMVRYQQWEARLEAIGHE